MPAGRLAVFAVALLATAWTQVGAHSVARASAGPPGASDRHGCAGAVFCEATYEEMRAAGFDTGKMERVDARIAASLRRAGLARGRTYQYDAWVEFWLYKNSNCSGTVKYNQYCGWLHHKYMVYDNPPIYTTTFPARSGDNVPADEWIRNLGPIPDDYDWKWGYMNGDFFGYEADASDTFSPGKWRLDPWSATHGGTTRGAFEIHGGIKAHDFWTTPTQGCIRLPATSITSLKGKWDNRTSNKKNAYVYVYY